MEFLLINHPLDCPICDQAGECKLQDNAVGAGPARLAHVRAPPPVPGLRPDGHRPARDRGHDALHPVHALHPLLPGDHRRRASSTFIERGGHTIVWTHEGKALDNDLSACAADVCPVGALTTKEFRFRKRVWWLDKTRSVCDGCEIGCNLSIEHRDRVVYRLHPARPARRERLLAVRLRPLPGRGAQRPGVHEARDPGRGRRRAQADELGRGARRREGRDRESAGRRKRERQREDFFECKSHRVRVPHDRGGLASRLALQRFFEGESHPNSPWTWGPSGASGTRRTAGCSEPRPRPTAGAARRPASPAPKKAERRPFPSYFQRNLRLRLPLPLPLLPPSSTSPTRISPSDATTPRSSPSCARRRSSSSTPGSATR